MTRTGAIAIVLPPKERFTVSAAGAVSLVVRDSAAASRFRDRLEVLGVPVATPFPEVAYRGTAPGAWRLFGRNRGFALAVARRLRQRPPALIEVHNRPRIAGLLARALPDVPVVLHLHNDPQTMAGLARGRDRSRLLDRLALVVCVSAFVRARLLEGIADPGDKARVLHNGVVVPPASSAPRRREILFVGRLIPDKGVAHFAQALAAVLPTRPGWSARFLGAAWFGDRAPDAFARSVRERPAPLGDRVRFEGFVPHDAVLAAMDRASIVVVPTLIAEAFNRVAAEAMAAGCAVIAYPSGGLAEIARGRAWLTAARDPALLADALATLIDDPAALARLQEAARADFPYAVERVTRQLDDWREDLLRSPS